MEREGIPLSEVLAGLHEALGACQEVRHVLGSGYLGRLLMEDASAIGSKQCIHMWAIHKPLSDISSLIV